MKLRAKLRPCLDGSDDLDGIHCCGMCNGLMRLSFIHAFLRDQKLAR
jgi:hypothetical protein